MYTSIETPQALISPSKNMPKIGLGTYHLKGQLCSEIVESAINYGYKLFDTALLYKNQVDISKGIEKSNIERTDIFLTSKIFNIDNNIKESVNKILEELEIEYIDLVLLHRPINKNKNISAYQQLERLAEQDKIKHIGVSNYRENELSELIENTNVIPYLNQIELHPLNTRTRLLKFCQNNDIIVQSYCGLMQGKMMNNTNLLEISEKYQMTVSQLLLKWGLQQNIYQIPMTTNINHLVENINVSDIDKNIDDNDMSKISSLNQNHYFFKYYMD